MQLVTNSLTARDDGCGSSARYGLRNRRSGRKRVPQACLSFAPRMTSQGLSDERRASMGHFVKTAPGTCLTSTADSTVVHGNEIQKSIARKLRNSQQPLAQSPISMHFPNIHISPLPCLLRPFSITCTIGSGRTPTPSAELTHSSRALRCPGRHLEQRKPLVAPSFYQVCVLNLREAKAHNSLTQSRA